MGQKKKVGLNVTVSFASVFKSSKCHNLRQSNREA